MEIRIVNLTSTAGETEAERFSDLPKATEVVTGRARNRAQEFLAPVPKLRPLDHGLRIYPADLQSKKK